MHRRFFGETFTQTFCVDKVPIYISIHNEREKKNEKPRAGFTVRMSALDFLFFYSFSLLSIFGTEWHGCIAPSQFIFTRGERNKNVYILLCRKRRHSLFPSLLRSSFWWEEPSPSKKNHTRQNRDVVGTKRKKMMRGNRKNAGTSFTSFLSEWVTITY